MSEELLPQLYRSFVPGEQASAERLESLCSIGVLVRLVADQIVEEQWGAHNPRKPLKDLLDAELATPGNWNGSHLWLSGLSIEHRIHATNDADLAEIIVQQAVWEVFCDFADWPTWEELVERLVSMTGLHLTEATRMVTLAGFGRGNTVTAVHSIANDVAEVVNPLYGENLGQWWQVKRHALRFVLNLSAMCAEHASRLHWVHRDELERRVREELSNGR